MSAQAPRAVSAGPDPAFKINPDGRPPFRSQAYSIAEHRVRVRIDEGFDIIVLAGNAGTGKTTLLTALAREALDPTSTVFLHRPPADFEDLLHHCDRGASDTEPDAAEEVRPLIVLIDDADQMPIDLWQAAKAAGHRFQFILACLPGFVEPLSAAAQEVDAALTTCRLEALLDDEIASFIAHRLAAVGEETHLFDCGAVLRVAEYAGGTPRLVNVLCAKGRAVAASAGTQHVIAEQIDEAALLLGFQPLPAVEAVESEQPILVGEEGEAPEIPIPEIAMPEIAVPDIAIPGIAMSEAVMPEAVMSDILVPDIVVPDIVMPEIVAPRIEEPGRETPVIVSSSEPPPVPAALPVLFRRARRQRRRLDTVLNWMHDRRIAARASLTGALVAMVAVGMTVARIDRGRDWSVAGIETQPAALVPIDLMPPQAKPSNNGSAANDASPTDGAGVPVPTRYVDDLLARGRALWRAGEFRAARMFLGLAAADGDPEAARELAETYDPYYVKDGAAAADRQMALRWYRAAASAGDREAEGRLFVLTHDHNREASAR